MADIKKVNLKKKYSDGSSKEVTVYTVAGTDEKIAATNTDVSAVTTRVANLEADMNTANDNIANLQLDKVDHSYLFDGSGNVKSDLLPSYVDDVLEYETKAGFPTTGESGKIYVSKETNLTYRWSGSAYVEISPSLALGETSSSAWPGDKGKKNADDIANIKTTYATQTYVDNHKVTEIYGTTGMSSLGKPVIDPKKVYTYFTLNLAFSTLQGNIDAKNKEIQVNTADDTITFEF